MSSFISKKNDLFSYFCNEFNKKMQDFTNNSVDLDILPKYEEVSFLPIHKKYWNVMVINLLIFVVILFVATAIAFVSVYQSTNLGAGFYVSILAFVFGFIGLLFWLNRIAFKKRGYLIREKDLLYRSGILATTTVIIPFNRIQHIAVHEGMFSRMYGLASLEIYTAGGNSSDLSISGIDKQKAYTIKEFLMKDLTPESSPKESGENTSNIEPNTSETTE